MYRPSCGSPDVTLADEHAGMVNRLGQTQLEDLGLQAPLQEVLYLQAQDVIQLHLALVQHSDANKPPQQSIACDGGVSSQMRPDLRLPQFSQGKSLQLSLIFAGTEKNGSALLVKTFSLASICPMQAGAEF